MRKKLTEAVIRDLAAPEKGRRLRVMDTGMPGLCLRVSSAGKRFEFLRRQGGKLHAHALGPWPAVSLDAARSAVRELGSNPGKVLAELRAESERGRTLGDAWAGLNENPARSDGAGALRPATVKSYRAAWGRIPEDVQRTEIDQLTGDSLLALRDAVLAKHGVAAARGVMALVSRLCHGLLPRLRSGARVSRPKLPPHARPMREDELQAWMLGLAGESDFWRTFWQCALLGTLRVGNLREAQWQHIIDLDGPAPVWSVCAERAKGRRQLAIPVDAHLASVLRAWRSVNPKEQFLFPSALAGGVRTSTGHIVEIAKAFGRTKLRAQAVLLCRAIARKTNEDARAVLARFEADMQADRAESFARRRRKESKSETPLSRAVGRLDSQAEALGIATAGMRLDGVRPHDLRASWASVAISRGVGLEAISKHLGHAQIGITQACYAFLNDRALRTAAAPAGDAIARLAVWEAST